MYGSVCSEVQAQRWVVPRTVQTQLFKKPFLLSFIILHKCMANPVSDSGTGFQPTDGLLNPVARLNSLEILFCSS